MRKAQMALQHGKARVADGELAAAEREYQAALEEAREHALAHDIQTATQREELERVRSELAAVREELRGTGGNLDKRTRLLRAKERELAERTAELEAERVARMAAEQRAEKALKSLEEIAKVRQEDRGLIITIGGSLLFKSAQSDLLPIARNRLNQVATALMSMEEDRLITVEGHTDSRGSEDYNMRLSIARAEAVRAYLIERGIEENRIKAVGRGESMPIADNNTAEGRANNRRVEIIVNPPQGKKVTSRP